MVNSEKRYDKINILIAEDEKNIGDLLVDILSTSDRRIQIVHTGMSAIKALNDERFDLLITDLMMPDADGMEVLHEAKRLYPQILVIIITGYASLETAIQAVREGAYDYLKKPFRLEELKISVDNACDKITLLRENRMLVKHLHEAYIESKENASNVDENKSSSILTGRPFIDIYRLPPSFFETGILDAHSPLDTIERLTELRNSNMITSEEFATLKKKLINSLM